MSAKRKLSAEEEDAVVDDSKTAKLEEEPVKDVSVPPPPAEPVVDKVKGDDGCGELLVCGSMAWDMTGRKALPKGAVGGGRCLWTPHRLTALQGVRVRLVASGCCASHSVIVTEQGSALAWGRNEHGQLGLGDTVSRHTPEAVPALAGKTVVGASCGRRHTLYLVADGNVFAAGDNKMGQCGVGNTTAVISTATKIAYAGPPLVKVGCGGEFSIVLDIKGAMHSFGCPEYGQLGHNTDGKYFVSCNKLGFHCETSPKRIVCFVEKSKDGHATPVEVGEIVDLSCGANHTVAVDDKRRVFSWGWGGLGRLGHAEQKDELVPRLLKFFDSPARGVRSVHCGSSFSLALNQHGVVFMFGQTRRTGEANMYPKPVQDLNGWNVRCIGAGNTSIIVAADESVIAWGSSPTYGELGLGEGQKSSANPREVRTLDGVFITQLASGFGHSLLVARDDTDAARAAIAQMPEYQQ